jgi:peptidoglycan/LPS O-acetylase OafA/YrhL
LLLLVFIGTGILFYRLFLEHNAAGLQGLDLYPHYTFVALIFGAVFPFILLSLFPLPQSPGLSWRLSGALLVGIFALIAPLTLLVLWGLKATLGFLAGSVAAMVFTLLASTETQRIKKQGWAQAALLVLLAQVSAGEFSGLLSDLVQLPRLTKVVILTVIVVAGLLLTKVWSFLHRPVPGEEKSEYAQD